VWGSASSAHSHTCAPSGELSYLRRIDVVSLQCRLESKEEEEGGEHSHSTPAVRPESFRADWPGSGRARLRGKRAPRAKISSTVFRPSGGFQVLGAGGRVYNGWGWGFECGNKVLRLFGIAEGLARLRTLISHKVVLKSFCRSELPHKLVNLVLCKAQHVVQSLLDPACGGGNTPS
jgi:hypothetical protein